MYFDDDLYDDERDEDIELEEEEEKYYYGPEPDPSRLLSTMTNEEIEEIFESLDENLFLDDMTLPETSYITSYDNSFYPTVRFRLKTTRWLITAAEFLLYGRRTSYGYSFDFEFTFDEVLPEPDNPGDYHYDPHVLWYSCSKEEWTQFPFPLVDPEGLIERLKIQCEDVYGDSFETYQKEAIAKTKKAKRTYLKKMQKESQKESAGADD